MYLKDITFINDGNPDTLEADFGKADFINFDKRQKLANVVLEIRRFQVVPYDVKRDSLFRRYLENIDILEDIELYNQSLVAEARAKKTGSVVIQK
jgi:son of sevenless-like protein